MELFQDYKEKALGCEVVFNGDVEFEIGDGEDKHTVFLDKKLCTCRVWELTGIPCSHAICALGYLKVDPISSISEWYYKEKFQVAYQHPLQPVGGKKFIRCDQFEPIEPPPVTKLAGRPRKKRIRTANEPNTSAGKLSKRGQK